MQRWQERSRIKGGCPLFLFQDTSYNSVFVRKKTYVYLWLIRGDVWQRPNIILLSNFPVIKKNRISLRWRDRTIAEEKTDD